LLLIGLLGLLASAASRALSDTLTFAVSLTVTTNTLQYVYGIIEERRCHMPHFRKWGPFYLLVMASIASMADITRQILLDARTVSLVTANGSPTTFNLDKCSYEVVAFAREVDAGDTCTIGKSSVKAADAFGTAWRLWMQSSSATSLCGFLSRVGLALTIAGFLWLADAMQAIKQKWARWRGSDLDHNLLKSEF